MIITRLLTGANKKSFMKKMILSIIALTGVLVLGCTCSREGNTTYDNDYPLSSFAVAIGESYYHANINQEDRIIEIGLISNTNYITGVEYVLGKGAESVSPDPESFLGEWDMEQTMTVVMKDGSKVAYTIRFPEYDSSMEGVIFYDDFDTDGNPDESKWQLWKRGTSESNEEQSESYDYAYVKDGNLVLVADKENGEYKSGGIMTKDKFSFTFGTVEVRARITRHPDGNFPAIWMMPQIPYYNEPNPISGEIDIMEHIKQEAFVYQTIHTNYTFNLKIKDPSNLATPACDIDEYNVYGMTWTEDCISFSLNGQTTLEYPNLRLSDEAEKKQWPFTAESSFYLILNMSLGSDRPNSWPGPIDDAGLPAIMEVDWVKVYEPDTKNK